MENILNKIIKYSLYSLVFLFPLFFLPWTAFPVALNKQMLLAIFAFFLLTLWIIKIINTGKLSFVWNKLTGFVLLLLLVLGISTAFSGARAQSFWGMSFEPDTLFSFILYGLVFLLFANLLKEKKEILKVISCFLVSSGVLAALFLIQSFWRPIFPWDFAKTAGFNPIGTVQGLAIFLGGAFVILIALSEKITLKKLTSILAIILGVLLFVSILLINYWVAWLGIVFATTIIIWSRLKFISDKQFPLSKISFPLIILAVSLTFIFIKVPTGNIVSLPAEVTPTYRATLNISKATLNEGPKNFMLGSGPATFAYDYDLHRSVGPNLTVFWQVRFNQGTAFLPTLLATSGILGILAVLLIMAIFFWQGFKTLISINQPKSVHPPKFQRNLGGQVSGTQLAAFVGIFYFLISWFFYPANLTLMAATFLMLGLWTATTARTTKGRIKEFSFTQSPQKAFFIMLLGVFLMVGVVVGFYNIGQKYRAALAFAEGLSLINAPEPKLDEAIISINKAAILDERDVYFGNLSQALLLKINQVLNNQELSQEDKQEFLQQLVQSAEMSANNAVLINPQNSQNWLQQGSVYENFMVVGVEGATEMAISSYQKAGELAPQNPLIPFNLGRVYKKVESFDLALAEFEKSIQLKNDFTPAYFLMAQVYELEGEKELALQSYQIVLLLEPGNEEIQAKIEELQELD